MKTELEQALQKLEDYGADIKQVDENKYDVFVRHELLKNIAGKDVIFVANNLEEKNHE